MPRALALRFANPRRPPNMIPRAIILAAGKGTRMKSARPKVLHELCGRPMLWYVLRALHDAGVLEAVLLVHPELEPHVEAVAHAAGHERIHIVRQEPQLGTGHAVQVALHALDERAGRILVINADMPLIDATLIQRLLAVEEAA